MIDAGPASAEPLILPVKPVSSVLPGRDGKKNRRPGEEKDEGRFFHRASVPLHP